jgi:two-component system phosphate regulon sensor histidine kinase PhoR
MASNPTVSAWFTSAGSTTTIIGSPPAGTQGSDLDSILMAQPVTAESLVALLGQGYRKLEPIDGLPAGVYGLWGVANKDKGSHIRIGFLFDAGAFITERIDPMLQAASSEGLSLGVFQGPNDSLLIATANFVPGPDDPRNALWLFPDTWLVLDLQDDQYAALVEGRMRRSAGLLLLAFGILVVGLILMFRTVDRQTKLAQMKTDFVSNVSHELRTPLSLIRMFAESLEMNRVPNEDKKQEYYRIIGSESERLGFLINNILDFSKMEAGKKVYHKTDITLNEVVDSVMDTYRYTLDARSFAWELTLDPTNPIIYADRDAVAEIIINLIENAIKYSPDEKHLVISTQASNGKASLMVADRGIGIAPDHQPRVFELFYRVESSLTHTSRGTGLGLAIVKRIADDHGASILLDSKPGKGSTFTVTFPTSESIT